MSRARRPSQSSPAAPTRFVPDPLSGSLAEVRRVQPFQATKEYVCPGCNQHIGLGIGHVVVVPLSDSSMRRHWHSPCWANRTSRRPGR